METSVATNDSLIESDLLICDCSGVALEYALGTERPVLYVDVAGNAHRSSWAPRLKTTDLVGRAIVIHSGRDNYSDVPKKLGGGGSRVACGLVVN